jgi:Rrf2 family protein
MKLQISSQLAVFAVLELIGNPDRQLSVGEIGAKYGVSNHHLAKVMHVLGRAGLVRSARGVGGGYQFCGNPRRTTLLDLIELFEKLGPGDQEAGQLGEGTEEARALHRVLREIDDIARSTLGSITIATMYKLMERHGAGRPRAAASAVAQEH